MTRGVQMRAAPDGARMIMHGVIGWEVTSADVARHLAEARGKPVTVSINSPGGDAWAGIAIHNMLARHDAPVRVVVDGLAASAASLIAMAGRPLVMPENAFLMLHNAHGAVQGEAGDMREAADVFDAVSSAYRRIYAQRSGKDEDAVKSIMDRTTYYTAAEAVQEGFADEVGEPREIRACMSDLAMLPHVPAALAEAARAAVTPESKEGRMPDHTPPAPAPEVITPQTKETIMSDHAHEVEARIAAAAAAEGQRVSALHDAENQARSLITDHAALAALREHAVTAKQTVEQFRASMFDLLAKQEPAFPNQRRVETRVQVVADEGDKVRSRMTTAVAAKILSHRQGPGRDVPEDAREFYGIGMAGMMREMLVRAGVRNVHRMTNLNVWDAMQVRSSAHSTSDFPLILRDAVNKTLQQEFALLQPTWNAWTQQIDVSDFKTINSAQIGTMPELKKITEGQPVPYGGVMEEGESYKVDTYAVIVELTREAIINDDLNAFGRLIAGAAETGYRKLADTVYGVLTANANMADGNKLFSSAHGNVGAGSSGTVFHYLVDPDRPTVEIAYLGGRRAPEVASEEQFNVLGASYRVLYDFGVKAISWRGMARERAALNVDGSTVGALETLLMNQKALGGARLAPPQRLVLLVPPSEHVAARRLVTSITPDSAANVNIYGGRLGLVVEPRLADTTVV